MVGFDVEVVDGCSKQFVGKQYVSIIHTHTYSFGGSFPTFFHNTTTFLMQLKGGGELICALPGSRGRSPYACFSKTKISEIFLAACTSTH